ncbi:MAG: CBS domain-containing protein [Candidatus Thermoplasmatota archaeon]|nr:CBS domain-containing protein [Candidatus Thermoplasmatota archaeon]MBU1915207.1 CBS domain-containing protein [Candidatus Thermoplasmatota archaeon]
MADGERAAPERMEGKVMYEGDLNEAEKKLSLTETIGDFLDDIVSKPATISTDATLRNALDAILASGVTRKAYVLDEEGRLRGTISVEILMRHVANRIGARPSGVISWLRFVGDMESDRAADFMSKPIPVTKSTLVVEIVRRVVGEHLNDFPILDEDGRLIGEVNTINLLKIARSAFSQAPAPAESSTQTPKE